MIKILKAKDTLFNSNLIIGMFDQTAGNIPIHSHDFYEINLIAKGEIIHTINDKEQILKENEAIFIRPRDIHGIKSYMNKDYTYINCAFSKNVLNNACDFLGIYNLVKHLEASSNPQKIKLSNVKNIKSTLYSIYQKYVVSDESFQKDLKIMICSLLSEFDFSYLNKSKENRPKWFSHVLMLMEEDNIGNNLDYFVKKSNISYQHFWRTFKKHIGQTPIEYINAIKMNKAAKLLVISDKKITDISFELGFSSSSHFHAIFKKHYGLSPKKYRISKKTIYI